MARRTTLVADVGEHSVVVAVVTVVVVVLVGMPRGERKLLLHYFFIVGWLFLVGISSQLCRIIVHPECYPRSIARCERWVG